MSSALQVSVQVNRGLWIAVCPRCSSAEHHGRHPDTGHVGGLAGDGFWCRNEPCACCGLVSTSRAGMGMATAAGCGLRCDAAWPANVDDIWALLSLRPVEHRNWLPGETLDDLLEENVRHGIWPRGLKRIGVLDGALTAGRAELLATARVVRQIEGRR